MKLAALIIVALLGAAAGQARGADWQPDAMFSQVGAGSATDAWSVGWQWHWRRSWLIRDSLLLGGRWDLAVGRWRAELDDEGRDHAWVTQVSAVPTLRLTGLSERGWYGEIGSGPAMLMPVFRSRDRSFSTEFNFQSHLALGYTLGAGSRARHRAQDRVLLERGDPEPDPRDGFRVATLHVPVRRRTRDAAARRRKKALK